SLLIAIAEKSPEHAVERVADRHFGFVAEEVVIDIRAQSPAGGARPRERQERRNDYAKEALGGDASRQIDDTRAEDRIGDAKELRSRVELEFERRIIFV